MLNKLPVAEITAVDATLELNGHIVFERLNFEILSRSFFCIIGPNGAGKTMLIRSLLGLIPLSSGSVRVLGEAAGHQSPSDVGVVPQLKSADRKFPALVEEVVCTGLHPAWPAWISKDFRFQISAALERVGALALMKKNIQELSGGELQRVYLARCLVRKRRLLILDEPATGIDVMGESDLYAILESAIAQDGSAVIMVTHDLDVARHHADRVLVMNGKQVAYGPPDSAITSASVHRAFGHSLHAHKEGHSHD